MFSSLVFCLATYLLVVRILRYRRVNATTLKHANDNFQNMTPQRAQAIVHDSLFYDAPMTMLLGTQVALFKVYGISSIASVLLSSGELTDEARINKRLADTAILIATFVSNPVPPRSSSDESNDPRAAIALARTNYLHGKYRINNDDFLYNLALFMLEPIRWTARFNWRPLTPTEIKAIFILWTDIGRHMGLENLWSSYEEMEVWADNYEAANMVPSEASAKLARITTQHFLQRVPPKLGLQRLVFNVMLTVLDTRTRKAMQLPDPNPVVASIIYGLFDFRAWICRHLCLPRRRPALWVTMKPEGTTVNGVPRMNAVFLRRSGPWYYPEATGISRIMQDLLVRLGLKDPNKVPGKAWRSDGYRLEELGPVRWENEGHREVMSEASAIQGSPITGSWSLASPKRSSENTVS